MTAAPEVLARRLLLQGQVQGVGFRPFVYRLAVELGLRGEVRNRLGQVEILAIADAVCLDVFQRRLIAEAPPLSAPRLVSVEPIEIADPGSDFRIAESASDGAARIQVPPDLFCCDDCLRELQDPSDRRHAYPFINCTQCGPRYTLIRRLPYDRPNTSMAGFALCEDCLREYRDPLDRRFHAEPVACPVCGPQIRAGSEDAEPRSGAAALEQAVAVLRSGGVLAVKGVGGYHLMCDAANATAVAALRERKPRPHKPLAVMLPRPLAASAEFGRWVRPTGVELAALTSAVRPIVLMERNPQAGLADNLAPGLDELGVMLPYSPLHQLLLEAFAGPLVATSGNLSGEPVLTDNDEVDARLARMVDLRLHHDRPILRPADDPVVRVIAGRARPIRLGRGNAPLEMPLPRPLSRPLLALGGHLKNTVCLAWEDRAIVSPHIGDMGTPRSLAVFEQLLDDLQALYRVRAEALVCDRHPGYTTARWARRQGLPVHPVWHHHAHASALVGEAGGEDPWLVFAWDGVGLGEDGTLWGGEALYGGPGRWRRLASWRPFRLPGGDKAGREPWRSALALSWASGFDWTPQSGVDPLLRQAWERGVNAPETSAAGRLFDAMAAFAGVLEVASFEGQGPMYAEALARPCPGSAVDLPLREDEQGVLRSDWASLPSIMADCGRDPGERLGLWHATAARVILQQTQVVARSRPVARVGLCGGVMQNRLLAETALRMLTEAGFEAFLPERVPVNDAGISFGQIMEVAAGQV